MRLIKIGLASVNSTVGAVHANTDRCIALARAMTEDDVTIALFPEQVIGGSASEDLVHWRGFVATQRRELMRFVNETASCDTVFVLGLTIGVGGDLYNAVAVVHAGKVLAFVPKEKLPTYNVLFPTIAPDRLTEWAQKFERLFTASIFKWVQAPLAIHVGSLDLDRERALQLPVVQRTQWTGQ